MRIHKIEYFRLDMPLTVPYTIAYETVDKTSNIILRLETETGVCGWGCAAPDLAVTGETAEDVIQNIENVLIGLIKNESPFQIARLDKELRKQLPAASSTIAMMDMALYDITARQARLPLYKLIGGYRHSIPTSITIGILPLEESIEIAKMFLKKGFKILKLKGGLNVHEDIEKVAHFREIMGYDFALRFDGNQGYTEEETMEFIKGTKSANIEILEQPTSVKHESELGKKDEKWEVSVMADESIKTLHDAFRLANDNLTDMVNIKLQKVGGIQEALHINSVSKAAGMEVMVGCLDECALGISAGLHFALSRPNIEYADLDGHLDLLEDPFTGLFHLKDGVLYPTEAYGLGEISGV